ncbi:AcrR family transcriptional regulator [Mycobacterium sp. OAS707]|uniref:acyl-CoA-like ligand-binding transcription factor n=1 Tax=Mycobacterium sp. OAS707 TaxID=2663822 RepID=UPI001789CA0C|nr:TetR family transcriptional regulator [Mycobacterium sp. OAS707]MBE1551658.1 AcrR family transcriptional regulator [Mycobacterium sp. OAS707]
MGVTNQILGLRDRKKIKTRDTIRREAMRLIEENGYASTTVEQIAEAAEVSPSTFFRYFPSKEMVLMANDLDLVTVDALEKQPPDMPSLQAFRRALEITMATLSEDEWRFERARIRMVLSIPELKSAQFDEYRRTVTALTEADCRRTGREPDDFEVRVFVGALAGGLMAVLDHASGVPERMYRALDFMEAGMPLRSRDGES